MTTPYLAFKESLQQDNDYAWTWHASLACSYMDEGATHEQANRAAANFMRVAFDVDVTKFDEWQHFRWVDQPGSESFRVYDESQPDRQGICHSYSTHFDIQWDDGKYQTKILDLSDIGVSKVSHIKGNIVTATLEGGQYDGVKYYMTGCNHKLPDGLLFNSPGKQSRYAISLMILGSHDKCSDVIYKEENDH